LEIDESRPVALRQEVSDMNLILTKTANLFYIYQVKCTELDVFYIGSHACTKTMSTCRHNHCKYMGSGFEVKRIRDKYPNSNWSKTILAYAKNREELSRLEIFHIQSNINDPNCLNRIIASPSKLPTYTKESKKSLKESNRRKYTDVYSLNTGEVKTILISEIPMYLKLGWRFSHKITWLKNVELKKTLQVGSHTATETYIRALDFGWIYGYDSSFDHIKTKEYLKICNLKKVVITHTVFESLNDSKPKKKPFTLMSY